MISTPWAQPGPNQSIEYDTHHERHAEAGDHLSMSTVHGNRSDDGRGDITRFQAPITTTADETKAIRDHQRISIPGTQGRAPYDSIHHRQSPTHLSGPNDFLISPPASSHDDVGNSPPNGNSAHTPSPTRSRQSSQQPRKDEQQPMQGKDQKHTHYEPRKRDTPESGSFRRTSSSSFDQSDRRSDQVKEQPMLPSTSQQGDSHPSPKQRTPRRASDILVNADPESVRLIKELQAQDLGLRRRAARS